MAQQGRREILVAGYPSLDDSNCYRERFEGLCSSLDQNAVTIRYVSLVEPEAFSQINRFLYTPTREKALFSIEFGSNKILAAQFIHNHVPIDVVGFGVFISPENEFTYPGLPPIPSYSPSLRDLGRALATRLFEKWRTGTFDEPFVELL